MSSVILVVTFPVPLLQVFVFDLFLTDIVLKHAYFSLMPAAWKIKFAESGQILNNVTHKHQNLIRFMAVQEALSKHSHGDQSSKRKAPGHSGGHGAGDVDVDVVVVEIVSIMVEVVAAVVATSPAEGVVEVIMLLTLLILRRAFLALHKDVVPWDAKLLEVLQVVVVDKVVVSLILLVVLIVLLALNGDGVTILPVVIGDVKVKVKAVADLPHTLHNMQTSTTRAKKTLTKDTMNSVMPMGKNSTVVRNKNNTMRKDRQNMKNSTKGKLEDRKKSSLRMPIGLISLESDIRSKEGGTVSVG